MMFYILTVILSNFVMLIQCTSYDLLIIKVPKTRTVHSNNLIPMKLHKRIPYSVDSTPIRANDRFARIDIEHYDEPTELPDVDNIDFNRVRVQSDDEDLDNNYGEDKIIGGVEVDINLYPYHAAYGSNCGGAIIDRKWILTAGHCGEKPFVRVGSKFLNEGLKIPIKSYHVHPMWLAKNKEHRFDYDYQLLELSQPLKFNDRVQQVKIGRISDMVVGKVVSVTGWGNIKENGPFSEVLRAVRVPIISKEECQTVQFPYFRGRLTPRMFCAGYANERKDACQGDSGGPAVANDRLLGLVSFGYGCATPGSYGVYSKVPKIRAWIEEVTGLSLD